MLTGKRNLLITLLLFGAYLVILTGVWGPIFRFLEKIRNKQSIDEIADVGGRALTLAYKEFEFKKGDVVYMKMASGGGYGDPLERDPQSVLEDVIDGLVSEQAAQEVYGVVLDYRTERSRRFRADKEPARQSTKKETCDLELMRLPVWQRLSLRVRPSSGFR